MAVKLSGTISDITSRPLEAVVALTARVSALESGPA